MSKDSSASKTQVSIKIDWKKAKAAKAGQRMIALHLFDKGKKFLKAAVLLEQKCGCDDVILHLVCQGLEIVQKALLLAKDYDRFEPMLRKALRHDLVLGAEYLQSAYSLGALKNEELKDLIEINSYYQEHLLRYSEVRNLVGGAGHLRGDKTLLRSIQLVKIGDSFLYDVQEQN